MLLRQVTANLWWREAQQEWLDRGEIPADCITDLKTRKNRLSVFRVEREGDAERVAAALALQKAIGAANAGQEKSLDDVAGIVFDEELVTRIGLGIEKSAGQTTYADVNDWHRDLIEVSGRQLVALAHELLATRAPQTFYCPQLLRNIREAVADGRIRQEKIPGRVATQIESLG